MSSQLRRTHLFPALLVFLLFLCATTKSEVMEIAKEKSIDLLVEKYLRCLPPVLKSSSSLIVDAPRAFRDSSEIATDFDGLRLMNDDIQMLAPPLSPQRKEALKQAVQQATPILKQPALVHGSPPSMPARAVTYYASPSGSDSSSGTSPSAPWKNCPGMTAFRGSGVLKAGDTVYFDSGGTWLTTGAWGLSVVGGVTYIGDTWPSMGSRATIRLNAQPTDPYGVVDWRRDDATAPTTLQGFDLDANNYYSDGVSINHAHYLTPLLGAMKTIDNVVVHNVSSTTSKSQYAYGIIVSNHGGTNAQVSHVLVKNSIVHDVSRDGLLVYPGDENQQCTVANVTFRNNVVYHVGQDSTYGSGSGIIVKGQASKVVVEYNYVYGPGTPDKYGAGIFLSSNQTNPGIGMTDIHVRYNIVNWNLVSGAIRLYSFSDPSSKDVRVYGNVVYNSTANGGFVINRDLKGRNSIRLYNNTFYNAPIVVTSSPASYSLFDVRNNIVYYPGGTPISGSGFFTAHSNNLATNPLFKNTASLPTGFTGTFGVNLAPNADGLSLAAGSAGIGAGIALESPYNGSIISVIRLAAGPWDIGAYATSYATRAAPNTISHR